MRYKEITAKVSRETGLPQELVDRAYRSYWRAVREHVSSLPLKEDLSDEEFLALQPNVNIPSIGKLYVTLERYRRLKRRYARFKEIQERDAAHKENQAPVHLNSDHGGQV